VEISNGGRLIGILELRVRVTTKGKLRAVPPPPNPDFALCEVKVNGPMGEEKVAEDPDDDRPTVVDNGEWGPVIPEFPSREQSFASALGESIEGGPHEASDSYLGP
jgi:hypothetical protein